ncbi:MAG: SNF2-related protein [Fusobacteriaceae bacterium]
MALLNLLSKIFKSNKDIKYEFKKRYEQDYIEIEIFNEEKRIPLEKFQNTEYEYLLKTDIFFVNKEKNTLNLPYESIYALDENSLEFFDLPKFFRGTLKFENEVNLLNKEGVKFRFKFLDGESDYKYFHKNLIIKERDDEKFFLREQEYILINTIRSYNSDNSKTKDSLEQYRIIEKIKKLKEKKEILLGRDIEKIGEVNLINSLELDFLEKENNNLSVIPIISGLDENLEKEKIIESFKYEFANTNNLKKKYSLTINGKIHEVVLSKELIDALSVVKENGSEISKEDFIKKDNPLFLDERMNSENIEYNYGPRVKGFGFLNYRTNGVQNNSDINWFNEKFPYIDTADGEEIILKPSHEKYLEEKLIESQNKNENIFLSFETDEGKKTLLMGEEDIKNEILKLKKSCKEIINFKKANDVKNIYELMKDSEEDYIKYKGCYVENLRNNQYIEDRIKELTLEEEEKNIKNEKNKKEVLIIKDNIENLEHNEENKKENLIKEYIKPKSLRENISLLPYQEEGVAILQSLYESNSTNGILFSDDMGLGKTLQILTFLAYLKEKEKLGKSIIVVPTSLINNWYNESNDSTKIGEIQKFFNINTFSVQIIKGKTNIDELNADLIITSYETLRINHIEFGKVQWEIMVCDEAQKIKNPTTLLTTAIKTQNAKFKIACSATPIENTVMDLWCLVDFSNPGLLGSLKEFKKKYVPSQLVKSQKIDSEALKNMNDELRNRLGNHFVRRTKDVLSSQGKKFPKKIIIYSYVSATSIQKDILNRYNELRVEGGIILPLIQGMIMACSHPKLIDKNDSIESNSIELVDQCMKLLKVKEILENVQKKNEKIIIFTKYKKMQKILSMVIKEWYGFNPSIINGEDNSQIRRSILDEFKNVEGFNVIILSPEAAGVGLNIVEANHVIHYTRHWNPAKEEQATDRVYRIGQTKDVYVYYPLISQNENLENLRFDEINDWIESNEFNFSKESSPEEKLNKIIMKKKKLLRDFFLTAPIDMDEKDFEEFKINIKPSKDIILEIEHVDKFGWDFLEALSIILIEKKYDGKGYLTKKTGDFGVDGLINLKNGRSIAIQVKHSKNKVEESALNEILIGRKIYEKELNKKINSIVVVTNSEIKKSLKDFENEGIQLIDRKILSVMLKNYPTTNREVHEKLEEYK